MELWMRSQDKCTLMKATYIYVAREEVCAYDENKCWSAIGVYSSQERALEVLDEIQEHIQKQGQSYILTDEKGQPAGLKEYGNIYEMPEK